MRGEASKDFWIENGDEIQIDFYSLNEKRKYVLDNYENILRHTNYEITTGDIDFAQAEINRINKLSSQQDPLRDRDFTLAEFNQFTARINQAIDLLEYYRKQNPKRKRKIKL